MIKLVVTNEKNLELYELEKVHVGENKFGFYLIFLPEMLNGYNLSECEVKLIQVFEDNTSVAIDIDTTQETRPIREFITLDATAQAQMVTLSVLITHNGNVIGKTNQKTYQVYPTKNATPIDPREDLDEIIAELRADKAELEETVSEQSAEITEKNTQITELSGEVTELTTENTRLENQHEADQNTIQYLIDNPPETRLQAKSVTPTSSMQVVSPDTGYQGLSTVTVGAVVPNVLQSKQVAPSELTTFVTADEGYDGLSSVTVDNINAEQLGFEKEYYALGKTFLGEAGEYHPFPENSYGGIYFTELNENDLPVGIKVVNYDYNYNNFSVPGLNANTLKNNIKSFILLDCKNVKIADNYFSGAQHLMVCRLDGVLSISDEAFRNCTSLTEISLPDSLTSIGSSTFSGCTSLTEVTLLDSLTSIGTYAFLNCTSLTELTLPDSLTSIGGYAFQNCTRLTNLTLAQGFNCNGLNVSYSTRFTAETIVACLEALADRTGQTAYTITFGSTNLKKLTNEQKAIAINKNWNLT